MPSRTLTCGECGARRTIADADWDTQAGAIGAWERQHEAEAHAGREVGWTVDPDPRA
jgi:hypothetical protein